MEQIRKILEYIHHGEMNFRPSNDSPEAIKEFQAIAKRIVAAYEKGYLIDVKYRRSHKKGTYGCILELVVIGGLTFEGEQFLSNFSKRDKVSAPRETTVQEDVIEVKPNLAGIGVNLNAAYRRFKRWWQNRT